MHFATANHERLAIQQESPTENSNRCGLCRVPAGCASAADGTARTRAANALGGASTLRRKKTRRPHTIVCRLRKGAALVVIHFRASPSAPSHYALRVCI